MVLNRNWFSLMNFVKNMFVFIFCNFPYWSYKQREIDMHIKHIPKFLVIELMDLSINGFVSLSGPIRRFYT